jgi:hypothetical protein
MSNVLSAGQRDTVVLTGEYHRGVYHLQAQNLSGVTKRDFRASPSLGWAFLLPLRLFTFGPLALWLTALYLAFVWCLLGYWNAVSVRAGSVSPVIARMAAALVIGLAIIPVVFGLPVAHWSEWVAAGLGIFAGWRVATLTRRPAQTTLP